MPQVVTEQTIIGDILHTWQVKEYEQHDRSPGWHVFMFVLGGFLLLYSIISGNLLFSAIIILSAIILYIQSKQEPHDVSFAVAEFGVIIGNRFYSYKELGDFYIIYQPPQVKNLYIETKSPFRPLLRIPLLDNNPLEIRADLRQFLHEDMEKEEEPAVDQIARWWRIH